MTVPAATGQLADRRIRGLRPAKPTVDAWHAHGTALDEERRPDGRVERAFTVFLAGAECPFTCAFCDLWRWTIEGPTPHGALPRQLREALSSAPNPLPDRLKLYNASNFFDPRAVPVDDWPELASHATPFRGVTVESHATTIGPRVLDFAQRLPGRLEVAIGLETIHPRALGELNKRMTLDRFDRAAEFLAAHGVDLRVFVLLGAPFVSPSESMEWTVRTAQYAAARGARMVAIIPVRGGNGELERLEAEGEFTAPSLRDFERALDACLSPARTVVTADLWDVERLPGCEGCRAERVRRMERINRTGCPEASIRCAACAS